MKDAIRTWNIILGASMVAAMGIVIWHFASPVPEFKMTPKAQVEQQNRAREATYAQRDQEKKLQAAVDARVWKEDAELVGPKALEIINQFGAKRKLNIASFRPQKPVTEGTLTRLPYLISLEGAYQDVVAFVKDIENPTTKLVVNAVQLASADGESSAVKATIGVWAMQVAKIQPKTSSTRTRRTTATRAGG